MKKKKRKPRNPYVIPSKRRKAGPMKDEKKEKDKKKCRERIEKDEVR